jgi:sporulation protein YlmC with PRC-barrel domain
MMMKATRLSRLLRTAMLPAAAAAMALSAQAQGAAGSNQAMGGERHAEAMSATASAQNYRGMRASRVIGMEVRNPEGRNIGQIRDMVVDMNTGQVRYTVLEFDPGIFEGERLFAVPTHLLRLGADDQLVYNMTRDRLEQAAVPRTDWDRAWNDPNYMARVDKAWGVVQPAGQARAYRVSDLLGMDVNSRAGEEIGEIEDLVINMAAQEVHYAVLEFDPSWVSPERNFAFPLNAFNLTADRDELMLDVDRSKVQAMKSFDDSRYSNLDDQRWLIDVDRYLVTVLPASDQQRSGTAQSADRQNAGTAQSADRQNIAADAELFGRLDHDGSGSLEKAEVKQSADVFRDWDRIDWNKDGRISRDELTSGYTAQANR